MFNKSKRAKKIAIGVFLMLFILVAASFIYVNDFYKSSAYVSEIVRENASRIETDGNLTVIRPLESLNEAVGLIFYPGGKVESTAYMPLLIQLSDLGITCILVDMPVNLAVFDVNAADEVYAKFPNINTWYLGGHSLGGAMASSYMKKNYDKVEGLILLGAYPINDAPVNTLAIYGTYDIKLELEKVSDADEVYEIMDGNHAYFGDYGEQEGDGTALISREKQQSEAVMRIKAFVFK